MARLLSVNVGLPRDIEWRGRTVHTAIWKNPVNDRCLVGRLNLDGDGQSNLAGHGVAHRFRLPDRIVSLLAGPAEEDQLVPGQFGENFTIEGSPDDAVCIGDRYQIGSALFEVTQPRVTCYRVGIRINEPRMPALLTSSGPAAVLFPRPAGRRGRRRRRNREGGRGEGANDRRRDKHAPLFTQSCKRPTGARIADRSAFARMALVV